MTDWFDTFFDVLAHDVWDALVPDDASDQEAEWLAARLELAEFARPHAARRAVGPRPARHADRRARARRGRGRLRRRPRSSRSPRAHRRGSRPARATCVTSRRCPGTGGVRRRVVHGQLVRLPRRRRAPTGSSPASPCPATRCALPDRRGDRGRVDPPAPRHRDGARPPRGRRRVAHRTRTTTTRRRRRSSPAWCSSAAASGPSASWRHRVMTCREVVDAVGACRLRHSNGSTVTSTARRSTVGRAVLPGQRGPHAEGRRASDLERRQPAARSHSASASMPCCWASPPPSFPNIPPPPRIIVSLRLLAAGGLELHRERGGVDDRPVAVHHSLPAPSALGLGQLAGPDREQLVLGPELAVDGLQQQPLVGHRDARSCGR